MPELGRASAHDEVALLSGSVDQVDETGVTLLSHDSRQAIALARPGFKIAFNRRVIDWTIFGIRHQILLAG